jgi:hypothetical protein
MESSSEEFTLELLQLDFLIAEKVSSGEVHPPRGFSIRELWPDWVESAPLGPAAQAAFSVYLFATAQYPLLLGRPRDVGPKGLLAHATQPGVILESEALLLQLWCVDQSGDFEVRPPVVSDLIQLDGLLPEPAETFDSCTRRTLGFLERIVNEANMLLPSARALAAHPSPS